MQTADNKVSTPQLIHDCGLIYDCICVKIVIIMKGADHDFVQLFFVGYGVRWCRAGVGAIGAYCLGT